MRAITLLGFGLTVGALLSTGCAANKNTSAGGTGGQTTGGGGSGATNVGGSVGGTGGQGGFQECNKFTAEATQAPAAMLFVLDRSASMSGNQKWSSAQLAVVNAIDKDVFDSMSLGLVTFPQSTVDPPQCFCTAACGCDIGTCKSLLSMSGFPGGQVACGISGLPQVAMSPAGPKSNAGPGTRKDMYTFLADGKNGPVTDPSDASPIYDAMAAGYNALQSYPIDRRILVLITDGGFSCTSVAVPARPGISDGACPDWEDPKSVETLIAGKRTDPQKPVFTFIVGVPGSNSHGETQGSYATAPYQMLGALSSYAVNGSPDTVDPACTKVTDFKQGDPAPALPCHFDLSSGAAFNSDTLASAIQSIRGKALGCVYDLPPPPSGQEIDKGLVNVDVTLDGATNPVLKRSDPNDACAADGCWDYNVGGQVQILGKTCEEISKATSAKVDIKVGCSTILK